MRLVFVFYIFQYLQSLFFRRLLYGYLLETAVERSVFLEILAIFILRSSAYTLQTAVGQRWF